MIFGSFNRIIIISFRSVMLLYLILPFFPNLRIIKKTILATMLKIELRINSISKTTHTYNVRRTSVRAS